jgi:hypothetical protein
MKVEVVYSSEMLCELLPDYMASQPIKQSKKLHFPEYIKRPVVRYPSIPTSHPTGKHFKRSFTIFMRLFKTRFFLRMYSPAMQQFSKSPLAVLPVSFPHTCAIITSIHPSIYLYIYLSIHPSVCLSIYLPTHP